MANSPICSIEDCGKTVDKHGGLGWCAKHYARWRLHGDPHHTRARDATEKIEQFIRDAISSQTDECFIWPSEEGTPKLRIFVGKKTVSSFRYMCERAHGEPPTPAHECAHSCGNGCEYGCVNPRHLRWATAVENQADRLIHGTDMRGEKHNGVVLTRDDVRAIRERLRTGESQYSIARSFSVSRSAIASIWRGRSWWWLD